MSELADQSIVALRAHHDHLEKVVNEVSPEQLSGPSGALEWTVAQVLSHLGSGAEINRPRIVAATSGEPASVDNQAIWDRWDSSAPAEQAAGFVEHDQRLVETFEALTPDQRESAEVDLGFLPQPVPLTVALGMRLNEVAAHTWDIDAGLDDGAEIDGRSARLLLDHFAGGLGFLLGFAAKADELGEPTVVALDGYAIRIGDAVSVTPGSPDDATATFTGPLEAAVRLLSGRLRPDVTPDGVDVSGNVTLDDLRRVFPGY